MCASFSIDFAYAQGSLPPAENICIDISKMNLLIHLIQKFWFIHICSINV